MTRIFTTLHIALQSPRKNPWRKIAANAAFGVVICALCLAATAFFGRAIEARVASARERLLLVKALEERQSLFVTLNNDYKHLEPLLPAVRAIVPPPERVVVFDDAMTELAEATGNRAVFQLDTQEPAADQKYPEIARVGFSATLEGSGETFRAFLARAAGMRFLHTIDSVAIDGPDGIYGQATMRLRGTVFIIKNN